MLALGHDDEALVLTKPCTFWDEVTADDVLLETFERIDLTIDSGIIKHLGRFLEDEADMKL